MWARFRCVTYFVEEFSLGVLTSDLGVAYNAAIETAPPLSGASSALPEDAGAYAGSPDGFLSEFGEAALFEN